MRRATRYIVVTVLAGAAIAVWAWRLSGPRPPEPRLPAELARFDPDVAAEIRQAAADVSRHRRSAAGWFDLGLLYEAHQLFEAARDCYEQAVTLRRSEPTWWYRLARMCETVGDLNGAITAMDEAAQRTETYAPVHWRLGLWQLERGDLDAAHAAVRRALAIDPDDPRARLALARVHLQRGAYGEAAELLEPLAGSPGRNTAYANQLLGLAYRQIGRHDEAEAALRRGRGGQADWQDRWQVVMLTQRRALGDRLSRARSLVAEGRTNETIALLEQMRRRRPHDANILNNLAIVYRLIGRVDESIEVLEEALSTRPGYYPAHFNLALAYLLKAEQRKGDSSPWLERAAGHLDRALAVNPTYAPAHGGKGDVLRRRGRYDEAIASYLEASRCDPGRPLWRHRIADVQAQLARWQDVIETLAPLAHAASADAEAFFGLAHAFAMLGRRDEARSALLRVAELSPADQRVATALQQLDQQPQPQPQPQPVGPSPR